jgi:hypothetical protein
MSLINEQAIFLSDVCRLLAFIHENNFVVTGGELFRPEEMQKLYEQQGKAQPGCFNTHGMRLAIDLNIFKMVNDAPVLTYDKKELQAIGDYWESLDPINKWGGNWKTICDTPHFERRISH